MQVRAAIYARQSKTERGVDSASILQQVADAKRLAEREKLEVVGTFVDEDRSGALPPKQWLPENKRSKFREGLTDLLKAVESGQVQAVICRKTDRLSRAKLENALKLFNIFHEKKVKVYCTNETNPDLYTSTGELQLNILMAFSAFERRKIADNVKATKEYLKREGKRYHGWKTFGYTDNGESMDIAPDTAAIVREIFKRFEDGASYHSVLCWLRADHADKKKVKWYGSHVKSIVRNVQYIGKEKRGEEVVDSKVFPPIIKEDQFYKVQTILKARKGSRTVEGKRNLFSGLLVCGYCGEKMTAKKMYESKYRGYVCQDTHKEKPTQVRMEFWEEFAAGFLSTSYFESSSEDFKTATMRAQLEENMKKAKVLFSEGILDAEELRATVKTAKEKLAALGKAEQKSGQVSLAWESATEEQRRVFLFNSIERITVFKEKAVVKWNKGYGPNKELFKLAGEIEFPIVKANMGGRSINVLSWNKLMLDPKVDSLLVEKLSLAKEQQKVTS